MGADYLKCYRVKLISTGTFTQLPDSQKLFGALVYMFSEKYGDDKASILTKAVLEKKIHLSLSNLIPWGYLPTPQEFIIDRISKITTEDARLKEKRTALKKRDYISITALKHVFDKPESCVTVFPYVEQQIRQQTRVSIESERYDIPELDSKPYSVPTVELTEVSLNEKGKEQKKRVNTFSFYLQADDSNICADLLNMLNEAVSAKRPVILGKRASQGLNIFEFRDMIAQDFRYTSANCFLNMGMLLPDKIDFASSTLKLFTSERRPFEMAGGWDKNNTGYYISFIAEGSIIYPLAGLSGAGKSVKSPFNENRDIVFGNAFLYPILLS